MVALAAILLISISLIKVGEINYHLEEEFDVSQLNASTPILLDNFANGRVAQLVIRLGDEVPVFISNNPVRLAEAHQELHPTYLFTLSSSPSQDKYYGYDAETIIGKSGSYTVIELSDG